MHRTYTKEKDLQLLDELLKVALGGLLGEDLEHFLADVSHLASLSIAGGLNSLVGLLLGEGNGENTKHIAVGGAHINVSLNKGLPLSNQRAKLVAGHVHAAEVGDNIVALNILSNQLNLAESLSLIATVKVGEGELEHTALKTIGSDLCKIQQKSARFTAIKRSRWQYVLWPAVLFTMVLPALRTAKKEGALMA